jgi:ABC-type arginine transport system permease subunit
VGLSHPILRQPRDRLINECCVLSIITVPEIAMAAQFVFGETYAPLQGYAMVALLYWGLTSTVSDAHLLVSAAAAKDRRDSSLPTRFSRHVLFTKTEA